MKHDLSLYMRKCMIIGKEKTNYATKTSNCHKDEVSRYQCHKDIIDRYIYIYAHRISCELMLFTI